MIDLVKTHLTHPWGPPWTLETLGGPWRPLATLGDMLENDQFPPKEAVAQVKKMCIVGHPSVYTYMSYVDLDVFVFYTVVLCGS